MHQFDGKCVRGPWDGQYHSHWSMRLNVEILDGMHIRSGAYEWFDGVWIWGSAS